MKTRLIPGWLRLSSQLVLALPMVGFFSDIVGSDYFKQYVADVLVSVIESFGTALIHVVVQAILYGAA
ncbi:MAG: hypothetical protein GX629_08390 [Phycisphaerae bacterium]|jgi:hypothetical protein|nr:hypothetical protein [Phycisphaerae bacterium]